MRKINIFTIACLSMLACSCTDVLNEQPRATFTPEFFKTTQGIESGLTAAYSALRFQYGPQGAMTLTVPGTDEATYGGDGDARNENDYGVSLNTSGHLTTPWNRNYTFINTCSGIVEFGPAAGKPELVAEAKFLRAQYYFNLVTTFGGVPLDLGSGELKFNTSQSTTSVRNTAIEVYEAIAQDLEDAFESLPLKQEQQGRVTKATALHYLAKTYLAMACYYQYDYANELGSWESPQPNPAKATEYYQLALARANELLDNRSTYNVALLPDYADVNKPGNEHNAEVLFLVEHTDDYLFDESDIANGNPPEGGLKENRSNFMITPYYEEHGQLLNGNKLMIRSREYGRGWRRFVPTEWLLGTAYADKINDTRYYKTFQSEWKCNDSSKETLKKDNGELAKVGDLAIYMPGYKSRSEAPAAIQAKIDAAIASGARVWYSGDYTRNMFPTQMKFLDPNSGGGRDDSSHRPFLVAKLSETILIAAEAALMTGGDPTPYINELRERAAVGNPFVAEADAKAAMRVAKAAINLDFILNERSRELCHEQHRWFDLVRTGNLIPRLQAGLNVFLPGDVDNAKTNVKRYHHLRAIPQGQIDLMTNPDKADYQNPGYR